MAALPAVWAGDFRHCVDRTTPAMMNQRPHR